MKPIGKVIEEERKSKGISQRELARRCKHTDHSTISRIEHDKPIEWQTIVDIAGALEVEVSYLVEAAGYKSIAKDYTWPIYVGLLNSSGEKIWFPVNERDIKHE